MPTCGSCNETIGLYSLVKSVKCNGPCQGEFHQNCTSLKHQKLQGNKNIVWLCENCYNLCSENVPDQAMWNNLQKNVNNQVTISFTYLCDMEKRLKALEKKSSQVQHVTEVEKNDARSNHTTAQSRILSKSKFNRRILFISGFIALLILFAITLFIIRSTSRKSLTVLASRNYKFNGTLLKISKREWFAEVEQDGLEKLELPVGRVIIAHISRSCENKMQCDARVQSVQAFHIHTNGWSDIGYNFLVGGDGLVYEGRGWHNVGAHTKGYNRASICIAFIGTFNAELPTENDLKAAQLLIDEGVRLGALSKDYRLYGARQLSPTESPGKALYNVITKWPHWTKSI